VVTTLVSSALLSKMAAAHGVHSAETFTGFKWIARAVLDRPELRFVVGYEQALGYLVADRPLDKDGISAAVLFAEIAAVAAADGRSLQAWLDDIAVRFGRHRLADASVRMSPVEAAAKVTALRAHPPTSIGGRVVLSTEEYPEADLLRFELEGGVRVQIRPSGTEPKVKLYGEAVDEDPGPFVQALAALLT
jgi:phosphomannomutase